ncbi:RNA-binding protein [Caldibacillus thermolactis]|jgi:RNA-binding protein YlmH|uniref:RNA-binding protein n=1 Tax=Pallidibacillus thermolactis TaxID=251051 RepID=A0ABT2WBV2_9BACI|nr:RNA-binding protein [Pallidibacillus thermolactis]MCU9593163.1 RNA-binding protein [Pallidibacillus thermolactis]
MSIYQHFRLEEKEFIDQVLTWKSYVEMNYAPKLTDFLDPREQFIVQSIVGHNGECKVQFFGGIQGAERKRALLYPDYLQPNEDEFQIQLFEIHYPEKFIQLTHPKILGSLMGIGLKREKFGDILMEQKRSQFLCAKEIADYVRLHFHHVGKAKVRLEACSLSQAIQVNEQTEEHDFTVSSLRLDAVLSTASRLSREKAQKLIENGQVKVNFKIVESPSYQLQEGDLISARKIGRMKLASIGEQTRKNKWRITLEFFH